MWRLATSAENNKISILVSIHQIRILIFKVDLVLKSLRTVQSIHGKYSLKSSFMVIDRRQTFRKFEKLGQVIVSVLSTNMKVKVTCCVWHSKKVTCCVKLSSTKRKFKISTIHFFQTPIDFFVWRDYPMIST